mmetsp:Transcript_8484/g.11205  ORF Transcript_8484/g.11205 Transcript_8484/m.11205 type:complete len:108 (+) Transcript_8484:1282-1605(+)
MREAQRLINDSDVEPTEAYSNVMALLISIREGTTSRLRTLQDARFTQKILGRYTGRDQQVKGMLKVGQSLLDVVGITEAILTNAERVVAFRRSTQLENLVQESLTAI